MSPDSILKRLTILDVATTTWVGRTCSLGSSLTFDKLLMYTFELLDLPKVGRHKTEKIGIGSEMGLVIDNQMI